MDKDPGSWAGVHNGCVLTAAAIWSKIARREAAVAGILVLALGAYYFTSESLPEVGTWWDIAFLAFCLIPAVFALVLLALPLWRARGLLPVALALGVLAAILEAADLEVLANFAKLAAMAALGFWFLEYFESVRLIVLVAAVIPLIDAYSVWRGPTHHIVTKQPQVFTKLSFAFPVPGEHASANLGVPDLLFFSVFLAAAARFHLRVFWTWAAMTLSFGATMALAVWFDATGLPALPGLSIAFLAVNADRLWAAVRRPPPAPAGPADDAGDSVVADRDAGTTAVGSAGARAS